ncbi:hypothetical protein AB0J37_01855 [Microbispora rosea]
MPILAYEEPVLVPPPHSDLAAALDAARMEWLADHWSPRGGETA